MATGSAERPGWLVRIRRSPDAEPVGAGVLVSGTEVVTCAHVVARGAEEPAGPVYVEFQFATARHGPIPARVIEGGWWPQEADGSGDVAVLALEGELPAGAAPAPLREAEASADHGFRVYGYPKGHERNGVWSHGSILGPAEVEWIQLEASGAEGFSLKQGFSGSPIFDEELKAVVGIVVSTDREVDLRTGYGIPVEVICTYWEGLAPWVGWRLSHDPAMGSHWGPRARGVERDSRPGWYFTGRRQALAELVAWMEGGRADGAVRVVTGGPGSGKSAVLARLVALADPAFRARIEAEDPAGLEDPSLVPALGRVSVAVHAAGLDVSSATRRIAAAVSRVAEDPNVLIAQVRQRGRPLVVVVDALDEAVSASEARAIATKLLVPLARDAADVGVKVLVGTRPGPDTMFLRALGGRAKVIDLDDPRYFELGDLVEYAARSLALAFDPSAASPYCDDDDATAVVAQAIAEAAFPSFLVAGLAARARAEDEAVIDTSKPTWRQEAAFPADVDMAMADYLDRLGDPERAFDLLVPVAYARYPGLPRDDLWAPLAEAYAGKAYGPADVDWLLATAASFLLEETDDAGVGVVRLFHQALVDHIRSRTQPSMVEQTITGVLLRRAEASGGWLAAERYAQAHAASHAAHAGGGLLDRLVEDPSFLVVAERRGLLRVLPRLSSPEAKRAADCYRAAAGRLSGNTPADAAYLELASRIGGNTDLADAIRGLGLAQPFVTTFGRRRLGDDPPPAVGHTGAVRALAWGSLEDTTVLASAGDDGTIRLWDPADRKQLRVLRGHAGAVWGLSWGMVVGIPLLASAGFDTTIRVWDPAGGAEIRLLEGHTAAVRDVAWGSIDGAPVLASAGAEGSVRLWNPTSGTQLHLLEGHTAGVRAVAWGSVDGVPVLASGSEDGSIRLWDPVDGRELRVLEGHAGEVRAVAWGTVGGITVLASGSFDQTVRLWDPVDGRGLTVLDDHPAPAMALTWGTLEGAAVLASASFDGTTQLGLWDPASGMIRMRGLEGHIGWIFALAWGTLHGAPVLATASFDGTVRLWDPIDGGELAVLDGRTNQPWALAWGALEGSPVLACGSADGIVRLWDPATGTQLRALRGPRGWVWSVAWGSVDGKPVLAAAGMDGTVRLWDPATGTLLRTLAGARGWVWSVAWGSLDGKPVLAAAGSDHLVRLWDPADGTLLRVLDGHLGWVVVVTWATLDGVPVVVSAGFDGTVRLWDPATGTELSVLKGHTGWVWSVTWGMLDGATVLASAGADNTVRLWDAADGKERLLLQGHAGWVWSVAWGTLDGNPMLASADDDGRVKLCQPHRGQNAVIDLGSGEVYTVSLGPDGWLGIAGVEGVAALMIRTQAFTNPRTAQSWSLGRVRQPVRRP